MIVASVFKNGSNKAIRIPKQLEFDATQVTIEKDGVKLIITPLQIRKSWVSLCETGGATKDFMNSRDHLSHAKRTWK
jgi:antitoxin VapB